MRIMHDQYGIYIHIYIYIYMHYEVFRYEHVNFRDIAFARLVSLVI